MVLTLTFDAREERTACAADVKGACVEVHFDEFLMVKLEDDQVEIIVDVSKDHIRYVTCESLVLNKVLFGGEKSALLWCESFSTTLLDMGFKLNPHDLRVVNTVIDGKQCTIVWNVGDSKTSHEDKYAFQTTSCELEKSLEKRRLLVMAPTMIFSEWN